MRKPTLAIYDHTLHLIGGAQKYGCTIAHALQDDFDVTLITNKPVRHQDLQNWYQLDLSRCRIKTIPIPFYEAQNKEHLDPAAITSGGWPIPFISSAWRAAAMIFSSTTAWWRWSIPWPIHRCSSAIFRNGDRSVIFMSTATGISFSTAATRPNGSKKNGSSRPDIHLYPPVDMNGSVDFSAKENIILSAARFDPGGNKQQLRMVNLFKELSMQQPQLLQGWKLILAGGSPKDNPYLQNIRQAITGVRPAERGAACEYSGRRTEKHSTKGPGSSGTSAA